MSPTSGARKTSALVLIYDIRGFTAASRHINALELGTFAKEAHEAVLAPFAERPPTFSKNLGDGHLLLWEMPSGADVEPIADVVRLTERARESFAQFVAGRGPDAAIPKRIGFGIAFGEVSHADDWYGAAINRASRLQNLARPEGLALDPLVYEAAKGNQPELRKRLQRVRVRLKGLGRTPVWVARPFSWARFLAKAGVVAAPVAVVVGYVLISDAGASLPGGDGLRRVIDGRRLSLFRPVHGDAEVRAAADRARRALAGGLLAARTPDGAVRGDLAKAEDQRLDIWGSSQAICALMKVPHLTGDQVRPFLPGLTVLFQPDRLREKDGRPVGWIPHPDSPYTEAEPTLWTVAAIAAALRHPQAIPPEQRASFEAHLATAQRAAEAYHPVGTGAWNMFVDQVHPEASSPYATGLALLALLETREAGLPWAGSMERRDALLKATAEHLAAAFDPKGEGGWRGTPDGSDPLSFGFTWQAYATLLRAEADGVLTLAPAILDGARDALARLSRRDVDDLRGSMRRYDTGEFSISFYVHRDGKREPDTRNEAINFLWHPWAIETAVRWLDRAKTHPIGDADLTEARRALGKLVVDLVDTAVPIALSYFTFVASETLLGLSSVPPP